MKNTVFSSFRFLLATGLFLIGVFLVWFGFFHSPAIPESKGPAASSTFPHQGKNLSSSTVASSSLIAPPAKAALSLPLTDALARVTKKPFGIKVSPGHSPVSPERFSGYHAGIDFEIFPDEENADVAVSAICDGKVIYEHWVGGYGGVLVQSCKLANDDATVLYGHLRLSSISAKTGDKLKAGERIAVLGKGFSTETDGERKHLHLSIHRGSELVLLGYVQNPDDLKNWLDPIQYLR